MTKHLGLILFLNGWLALLLWLTLRGEPLKKYVIGGLGILLASLPFYLLAETVAYVDSLFWHNPFLDTFFTIALVIISLVFALLRWFGIAQLQPERQALQKHFETGKFFLVLGLGATWVISMDTFFHPLLWLVFLPAGVVLVEFSLKHINLTSERGYFYLLLLQSSLVGLIFYFSKLGQTAAFCFLPLYLALILFFQEAETKKILVQVSVSFILISNFFPNLEPLERWFGGLGFHIYSRGFNALHQNLLGWDKTLILDKRRVLKKILVNSSFTEQDDLFSFHPGLHGHQANIYQFPTRFLRTFPAQTFPAQSFHIWFEMFQKHNKNTFEVILKERKVPLLLVGDWRWSRYFGIEDKRLMEGYWDYLNKNKLLDQFYDFFPVDSSNPASLGIYVLKGIPKRSTDLPSMNQNLSEFKREFLQRNSPDNKMLKSSQI